MGRETEDPEQVENEGDAQAPETWRRGPGGATEPPPDVTQTATDEPEPPALDRNRARHAGAAGSEPDVTQTAADEDELPDTRWESIDRDRPYEGDGARYSKGGLVGRGGVGAVFDAFDHELSRAVVIKELQAEGRSRIAEARFERESQITAQLQHPGVIPVYGRGRNHDGSVFYAMKKIEGRTLRQKVEAAQSFADRLALLEAVERAAETVAFAHRRGIVHRDLKPSNIMVGAFGETVVIDWGLAKYVADDGNDGNRDSGDIDLAAEALADKAELTRADQVLGTPLYMSPQQARGEPVGKEADVYALGAILYQVLAGSPPYEGSSQEVLKSVRDGEKPHPLLGREKRVPPDLAAIVGKAMARRPQDRFGDAGELAAELKRFRNGNLVQVYRYSAFELARLWVKRNRFALAAFSVALVVGVGLTAWRSSAATRALVEKDLERARNAFAAGGEALSNALAKRELALEQFRDDNRRKGEPLWDKWGAAAENAGQQLTDSARAVEGAMAKAEPDDNTVELATQISIKRIELARLRSQDELETELRARLDALASPEKARQLLDPPSTLAIQWTDPRIATAEIHRYDTSREPWPLELVASAARPDRLALDAGSYVVVGKGETGEELVRLPLWLDRGTDVNATLAIAEDVPEGMVALPVAPYWSGLDAPDEVRRPLDAGAPAHRRQGHSFLIGRTEVTFAEWIDFLDALAPEERAEYTPKAEERSRQMLVKLEPGEDGWRLLLRTVGATKLHTLGPGDVLEYSARERDQRHPWTQLPVAGVSRQQAQRFIKHLRTKGRLPGARLCAENEWLRAGRGADRRAYPTGNRLDPKTVNIDVSYRRSHKRQGPNAVGLHPENASPFGVVDVAGNVAEMVLRGDSVWVAGGYWYGNAMFATVTTRQPFGDDQRMPLIGLRVCADYDGPVSTVEVKQSY